MKLYHLYKTIVLENVPNQDMDDVRHEQALEKTGFWGNKGSGAMIIAADTGRVLMPLRSRNVEQPGTWGTWGGAIDKGEDPKTSAMREVHEESGFAGNIDMIPLNVFEQGTFKYFNYIAVVPSEYEPRLNWETEKAVWTEFGKWPSPLHFGLQFIFNDAQAMDKIQKVVTSASASPTHQA